MSKNLVFSIYEIVGSPFCVASSDGQKVYDRIIIALKENQTVTLSFNNVTAITSAFLNAAIGQLYGVFKEDQIRSLLKVEDIETDDLALLKRVIETSKLYFKDPLKFDQAMQDVLEGTRDDE